MGKSDLKAEKKSASSSKKRKLSDIEDQPEINGTAAVVPKKAKKDKSSKKEKKDKKDKKPKKGSKEAKAAETEALNGEYDVDDQAIAAEEPVKAEPLEELPKKEKKVKKEKKEKKDKKKDKASADEETPAVDDEAAKSKEKKDKKDKKAKKAAKKEKKASSDDTTEITEQRNGDAEAGDQEDGQQSGKKNRFICFVGNLPFSATTADIQSHFSALQPTSVRLLTQRDNPTKSRGIAFVEFANYSHMKTCLAKFHHTEFTDATGAQRRINVELTAGGGGNTGARMEKVKTKNAKLNEERARRIAKEEEEKAAGKKDREEVEKKRVAAVDTREDAFVHPSRRAHVPGRRS